MPKGATRLGSPCSQTLVTKPDGQILMATPWWFQVHFELEEQVRSRFFSNLSSICQSRCESMKTQGGGSA
jgi:hypothetical protein